MIAKEILEKEDAELRYQQSAFALFDIERQAKTGPAVDYPPPQRRFADNFFCLVRHANRCGDTVIPLAFDDAYGLGRQTRALHGRFHLLTKPVENTSLVDVVKSLAVDDVRLWRSSRNILGRFLHPLTIAPGCRKITRKVSKVFRALLGLLVA
jgi:hypothetical protein